MADDAYVSLEPDPEAAAEATMAAALAPPVADAATPGDGTAEAAAGDKPVLGTPTPPSDEDDEAAPAGKTVPYQALREAREHLKTLKAQMVEMDGLRTKAAQADAILPVVEQWRPVIEAIQRDPSLVTRIRQPQADPFEARVSDQEAADYAKDIQLYTPEGQLDVTTAKRALVREHKIASQAAQEAAQAVVRPLQAESVQLKASQARTWALASAEQEGDPIDPGAFDNLWRHLPAELVAQNPGGIAQLVKVVARGLSPRKVQAAPPPPVMATEAPGGRTPAVSALTDLDRRFARELGKKPSEFAASGAKFNAGGINVLED